tara:strand:+ start:388 stop:1152 length:765 start_codon:yes stop_codon:yes gene_type:complete
MKKEVISVFILAILSLSFVAAYNGSFDLRRASEGAIEIVVDVIEPFVQAIFGGDDYYGLLLFEKLILFTILLSIVYISLKSFPIFEENKPVIWIVSIAIPLISVRFIDFIWLNTIIIQYQVLGIAILGILPFLVYLFFLHNASDSSTVRKIGWIFFIVIYFGLWSTSEGEVYGEVYFWTMLLSLVFLLIDKTIHRYITLERMKAAGSTDIMQHIGKLQQDIIKAANYPLPKREKDKLIKGLRKKLKSYQKIAAG